ncbi:MAG: TPM domain-containing protein, partial [Nitrospinota bacterium]
MTRSRATRFLLSLALVLSFAAPALSLEVPPPPRTRVTDRTGTLTPDQVAALERGLADFEQKTSNQILVLMIPTLAGDSLEDFAIRLAERWKPGQKGKDNGVILLIVKNDRKLRIEVGYGLEGALPDVLAGAIIRNEIAPRFRKGDDYGGILAGLRGIAAATRGEYKGAPARQGRRRGGSSMGALWYLLILLLFMGFGG